MALIGDHLHIHVHLEGTPLVKKIDKALKLLQDMAKKTDEIKALLVEQAGHINNISGDLDRIADRIENDPTEEELEAIAADIRASNAQLKTLADRNIVAETETPPTEEPEA